MWAAEKPRSRMFRQSRWAVRSGKGATRSGSKASLEARGRGRRPRPIGGQVEACARGGAVMEGLTRGGRDGQALPNFVN